MAADIPHSVTSHQPHSKLRSTGQFKQLDCPKFAKQLSRAAVAEEAISALVFAHAKDHSFFHEVGTVDYELLRAIKLITNPFEVRDRTFGDWEESILKAYSVWRSMVENNGGVFVGDSERRTVTYEPLLPPSAPA
jgi:hypothetical protein